MSNYNLAWPFWQASRRFPERLAIAAESDWSYARAAAQASAIAHRLGPHRRRVAILASRSSAAALAVLGACWCGAAYVPLSLRWPGERLQQVLDQVQAEALLVDDRGQQVLEVAALRRLPPVLHPLREIAPRAATPPSAVEGEALAYVIFTSGTTGVPKGVMVSASAVSHLLSSARQCFPLTPEDRVGCNFELSFDAAVFDMFHTWQSAASLHLVPPNQALAPLAFLRQRELSMILLTPSTLPFLRTLKALRKDCLPKLRWSLFGAEALPVEDALAWQQMAPASRLHSLYGPTENTVTSLWQPLTDPPTVTPQRETIALGRPLPEISALIVDDDGNPLPAGEVGQLALQGPQLADGYLQDPDLTQKRFLSLGGRRSYLTGDRAYQDDQGIFHHLGRSDHQVKVRGHRVELEEVETMLRAASGQSEVAALLWPDAPGQLGEIIAFVARSQRTPTEIQERLRRQLPAYALPARIHQLDPLPRNENGKIDRRSLQSWLRAHA